MKKLIVIFLLAIILSFSSIHSQPVIEWQKVMGGTLREYAYSVIQTNDGGFIAAGAANSMDGDLDTNYGESDCWIVKFDLTGNVEWQRLFGGSQADVAKCIQLTADGNFIVAGSSYSADGDLTLNHGTSDIWIFKLNSEGDILWQKSYGGYTHESASCIEQTFDLGFIVAGYTNSDDGDITGYHGGGDYWVIKLDSIGNIEWQKTFGGSLIDEASSVHQTSDSSYIVAGTTRSNSGDVENNHGSDDFWILKLDKFGAIEWQRNYGGRENDVATSIMQTNDFGYIVTGYTGSLDGDVLNNHGLHDYWILKIDSLGYIEWQRSYGGSYTDLALYVNLTEDGGYILSGGSESPDGNLDSNQGKSDMWIIKLNKLGDIEWQKVLGGYRYDIGTSIQQTSDGGFICSGYTLSNDGDISFNHGETDFWIVKLRSGTGIEQIPEQNISISPNPASDYIEINLGRWTPSVRWSPSDLTIFNSLGECVLTPLAFGEGTGVRLDISPLPPGVYFIRIGNENHKFIKF